MEKNKVYPIEDFYVGELYLYTSFGNFFQSDLNIEGSNNLEAFSLTGAINFQKDLVSRYTDWENKREYHGFLTIFYKQGDKYICLHDGVIYELNSPCIIDNLIPLKELLPKVNALLPSKINAYKALELFDIVFKKDESIMYTEQEQLITDFYIGDISLKESTHPSELFDTRIEYFSLPEHIMLEKNNLALYSHDNGRYTSTVYRCLFLRDIVDLYNLNNHQFYNDNEDKFTQIIGFREYMSEFKIDIPRESITIPKALKYFKKTL